MIILDTNVVSEPLRPEPDQRVVRWIIENSAAQLFLTAISLAELAAGAAMLPDGRRKRDLEGGLEAMLERLFRGRIRPCDEMRLAPTQASVAKRSWLAENPRRWMPDRGHRPVSGHAVATRDVSPFKSAGVPVINPWAEVKVMVQVVGGGEQGNVSGLARYCAGCQPDGLSADDVIAGRQLGQALADGFGGGLHALQYFVAGFGAPAGHGSAAVATERVWQANEGRRGYRVIDRGRRSRLCLSEVNGLMSSSIANSEAVDPKHFSTSYDLHQILGRQSLNIARCTARCGG